MMFWNCSYMSLRVNWPVGGFRGQTPFSTSGCCRVMLLTVLQLVDQIFVVIQFQVVNSVDQTLNVSHSCQ